MTLLIDIGNTALKWTVTDAAGAPGPVQGRTPPRYE